MLRIVGNKIYLTKGDSATLHFNITTLNGQPYSLKEGDKVVFTLAMREQEKDNYIIQKDIDMSTHSLIIKPSETKGMDSETEYVYDVQLSTGNGDIYTIIPCSPFIITCEVNSND